MDEINKNISKKGRIMKMCQIRMLKSRRVENDPFIGYCKVYECSVTALCHPCLFDVSTDVLLDDVCSNCERDVAKGE